MILTFIVGNGCFEGTFRNAIWPLLMVGQLFGVMPLIGVKNPALSDLQFKWRTVRTAYALFTVTVYLLHTLTIFWRILNDMINIDIFGMLNLNKFKIKMALKSHILTC